MSEVIRHQVSYLDLNSQGWRCDFDKAQGGYKVVSASLNGEETLKENLFTTLWSLGLKSNKIDVKLIEHRPLTSNKLCKGFVFVGEERTDDSWINGGYASESAIASLNDSNMLDMDVQIKKLENGGD